MTRWALAAALLCLTLPAAAHSQPAGTPHQVETHPGEGWGSVRARCFHAALRSPYNLPDACRTGLVPVPSASAILGLLTLAAIGLYSFIDPEVTEVYVSTRTLLAVGILAVFTVIAVR